MSSTTLLTDGSGAAIALARWLEEHLGGGLPLVAARGASDVRAVVAARRSQRTAERLVLLANDPVPGTVALTGAYRLAVDVLRDVTPIERRLQGARLLDQKRQHDASAADILDDALKLIRPEPPHKPARPKSGRPPGSNPFRGSGFDLCIALLEDPSRRWVERDLAAAALRSPSQVHKMLQQLQRRGYVFATKTGVALVDATVLRDELSAAWRGRVGLPRQGFPLLIKGREKLRTLFRSASKADSRCVLAGPSATSGPSGLVGGPPIVYLEFKGGTAPPALQGVEPGAPSVADAVVWPDFEAGVFLSPRPRGGGVNAACRVMTYLDLAASGNERERSAAAEIWAGIGKHHG